MPGCSQGNSVWMLRDFAAYRESQGGSHVDDATRLRQMAAGLAREQPRAPTATARGGTDAAEFYAWHFANTGMPPSNTDWDEFVLLDAGARGGGRGGRGALALCQRPPGPHGLTRRARLADHDGSIRAEEFQQVAARPVLPPPQPSRASPRCEPCVAELWRGAAWRSTSRPRPPRCSRASSATPAPSAPALPPGLRACLPTRPRPSRAPPPTTTPERGPATQKPRPAGHGPGVRRAPLTLALVRRLAAVPSLSQLPDAARPAAARPAAGAAHRRGLRRGHLHVRPAHARCRGYS